MAKRESKKGRKVHPFTTAQKGCAMERARFRDDCSYHATPAESIFYGVQILATLENRHMAGAQAKAAGTSTALRRNK